MKPEPVSEYYVRKLLAMSLCFSDDGQGSLVCFSEPCACAQTLLQEISRPLQAEIERLAAALSEEVAIHRQTDEALAKAEAEIERLKRDHAALELECASWRQSSALKLAEIERLQEDGSE